MMNEDEVLKQLPTVPFLKVEAAIEMIKKQFPDTYKDLSLSFEYLVGSFYPTIFDNMKSALKDAYTQGYAQGISEKKI